MPATIGGTGAAGLERSGSHRPDSIRFGPGALGVERAEVYLASRGFELHRHDTYGVGVTTAGVQVFRYRGAHRVCLPGQLHVLHPDERHDGGPGTGEGLGYRILYVAPELVGAALGGGGLPFVADPVQALTPATRPVASLLADVDEPVSDLARAEIAAAIADCLVVLAGRPRPRPTRLDAAAVERVREHLAVHAREQTPAAFLEEIAGTDRYSIARQFRRAFGTSPDRYRTLRRLALARAAIECGQPLADVAAGTGFADQSHMTRQFKRTYGLTPARWAALTAGRCETRS